LSGNSWTFLSTHIHFLEKIYSPHTKHINMWIAAVCVHSVYKNCTINSVLLCCKLKLVLALSLYGSNSYLDTVKSSMACVTVGWIFIVLCTVTEIFWNSERTWCGGCSSCSQGYLPTDWKAIDAVKSEFWTKSIECIIW
jgi:hypothetical protein